MLRCLAAAFAVPVLCFMWLAAPAVAEGWPPALPDLAVRILPSGERCLEGEDCAFLVRIENQGTAAYAGVVSVALTSTVPTVLGPATTEPWTCERQAFGKFVCHLKTADLAPGRSADLWLPLRMLATPLAEMQSCASLAWTGETLAVRNRLFEETVAAVGRSRPQAAGAVSDDLLRALFGRWGKGDARAGNDSDCTRIEVGQPAALPSCDETESVVTGTCVHVDQFCTEGRVWNPESRSCACPAVQPVFDHETRSCVAAAPAPKCSGGRSPVDGACVCPATAPLWDEAAANCTALTFPEPAPTVAETGEPSQAVVTPKPEKKPAATIQLRRPQRAEIHCGRGEVLRKGKCVTPRVRAEAGQRRKANRVKVFRQTFREPPCPPFFVYNPRRHYCWPALWLDPDVLVNGPIRRR